MRLAATVVLILPAMLSAQSSRVPARGTPRRPDVERRIDSLAAAFLREAPAAGVTLAVIHGRDTIALKGYGEADRATHRAAGPATIYRVGSVTKQFTAAAIMQLVEQHRLALTDTLGKFFPRYPRWAHVTIRQLLNHTSGIPSYTANESLMNNRGVDISADSLLARIYPDSLDFPSGTAWRYDNTGYFLLGRVLEKLTGRPYADIVREHFFVPLRMRSASYCPSSTSDTTFAVGYGIKADSLVPAQPISMTLPYAAGALCMSVRDFLRWQAAFTGGKVVTPASYARMSRADSLVNGTPINYGFALMPSRFAERSVIMHGGDIDGFSVEQFWVPDDSLRIIVFTNTLGSRPTLLANNLLLVMTGFPAQPRPIRPKLPPAVALDSASRGRYEGTFDLHLPNGKTLALRVFARGDGMMSQATGQPEFPLVYLGNDTFGAAFDPRLRLTIHHDATRATSATLLQGGATIEGTAQTSH